MNDTKATKEVSRFTCENEGGIALMFPLYKKRVEIKMPHHLGGEMGQIIGMNKVRTERRYRVQFDKFPTLEAAWVYREDFVVIEEAPIELMMSEFLGK